VLLDSRSVPDDVLLEVKRNGGLVMVNFYNGFVNCSSTASLSQVADHIQYIRDLVGAAHVGIGADYDGVSGELPTGLEDVSKYASRFVQA